MCERFYLINFSLMCFILNFTMVTCTYFVLQICKLYELKFGNLK